MFFRFMPTVELGECTFPIDFTQKMSYLQSSNYTYLYKTKRHSDTYSVPDTQNYLKDETILLRTRNTTARTDLYIKSLLFMEINCD